MDFQAGDIVLLKSGGPRMTVHAVDEDDVHCVWTEKNRTFRETFPAVVLKKWTPSGPMVFSVGR